MREQRESQKNTIDFTSGNKHPKTGYRLVLTIMMGFFVVFVMCWSVYRLIQDMDQQELVCQTVQEEEKATKNGAGAGKTLDVEALIQALLKRVTFETDLEKLDDSVAEGMITSESGTTLQVYMGNGSYADEIVVMAAKSENAAKKDQENAKEHLEEMQKMFQDYLPKEAEKIENAVRIRCGCYVIVCVTSDTDTANEVLEEYIEG